MYLFIYLFSPFSFIFYHLNKTIVNTRKSVAEIGDVIGYNVLCNIFISY